MKDELFGYIGWVFERIYNLLDRPTNIVSLIFCSFLFWFGAISVSGEDNTSPIFIQGVYSLSVYQGQAQPLATRKFNFQILLSDCNWVITYTDPTAITNENALEAETTASCDGTNIFICSLQNEMAVRKAWGDGYVKVTNQLPVATASILFGPYPTPDYPDLQSLWLTFCSACILKNQHGMAKPPFNVDLAIFYDPNYNCAYRWITNEADGGHRQLMLINDGTFYARNRKTGQVVHEKFQAPYEKGYVMGQGDWIITTNINGVSVPVDFEFTAFSPMSKGANSTDRVTAFSYRCSVTEVHQTNSFHVPPRLPMGKVLLDDRRFQNQGFADIPYTVTDRKWPSESSSGIERIMGIAPKVSLEDEALAKLGVRPIGSAIAANKMLISTSAKVFITRATICCIALFPVLLFFFLKKGRSK